MTECCDNVGPILAQILSAADNALQDCDREAGLVVLSPGNTVSWDNCCPGEDGTNSTGGQLWVRIISDTPQPAGAQPCNITGNQIRIGVGVIRCMHGLTDEGMPAGEDLIEDTLGMLKDRAILLSVLKNWEADERVVMPKATMIEGGLPLGPTGNCGGWEWTMSFKMLTCRCP